MIVLTVEFNRIPLSRRGRNRSRELLHRLHHPLDADTIVEVTENAQAPVERHERLPPE